MTEWIDGTRLDVSASPDVPRLCGVAINAYLTMLLDTGTLHCDPHPGNLLRTYDGRLCILDWGMTLQVPNDLQYALLEFIAHVNTEDLDAIPKDFVNLGFTPPDKLERVANSGITDGLSFMLRQLSGGGGAKAMQQRVRKELQDRYGTEDKDEIRKLARAEMVQRMEDQLAKEGVDVRGVSNVMEEMSRRNREFFQLPTWVLYVVRAFSTLEGIGLSVDESYAILKESYPVWKSTSELGYVASMAWGVLNLISTQVLPVPRPQTIQGRLASGAGRPVGDDLWERTQKVASTSTSFWK